MADSSVRNAATTVSTRPISKIGSEMPGRIGRFQRNNMQDRPTICRMVLYLASWLTFTLPRWPISAIHSRSAEMAISRPMMTIGAQHEDDAHRFRAQRRVPPSMPSSPGTMIMRHVLAHQQHQRHRDDELVGHRIEECAEPRGLAHAAREIAVERIGDAGEREQQARGRVGPLER